MSLLIRFKLFLDELEQKKYYQLVGLTIGAVVALLMFLFYMHNNNINFWQRELKRINAERNKARIFLEQHQQVEQQKVEVSEILAQNKSFKIKEYIAGVLMQLNLTSKLSKDPEVIDPQDLGNGFDEVKLDISFMSMSMQELVMLLGVIAENRRIYTKELDITKSAQGNTINVTLIIATLQPGTQT